MASSSTQAPQLLPCMLLCSMYTGCWHFLGSTDPHACTKQVPEWLEEPLLHLVHHSTTTLEGLIDKALAKFDGRYVVGEELAATDEGKERPCVIRAISSAKRPEGDYICTYLPCTHVRAVACSPVLQMANSIMLHWKSPTTDGIVEPADISSST